MVASAAMAIMAAIPMVATWPAAAATLVIPFPSGTEEERRDTRLLALWGGVAHGSPAWSELEEARGAVVRPTVAVVEANLSPEIVEALAWAGDLPNPTRRGTPEAVGVEREELPASCDIPVVDILSDIEEDTGVAQ